MKILIPFLIILMPAVVFGQTKIDQQNSSWNSAIVDYSLSNKVYLKNEIHVRRTNFLDNWQQLIVRPSVHYKPNDVVDLSVGYSYIKNFSPLHNARENNVWEQLQLSHKSGQSQFKHRFRFEQRAVDHFNRLSETSYSQDGTDYLTRFRYRFTWTMPILTLSNTKKINLAAFDEIWLNTGTELVPKSLNQNWFYVGLSYPIFANGSLGIGYMSDYAPVGSDQYRSNHILQTTFKYHFK